MLVVEAVVRLVHAEEKEETNDKETEGRRKKEIKRSMKEMKKGQIQKDGEGKRPKGKEESKGWKEKGNKREMMIGRRAFKQLFVQNERQSWRKLFV